MIYIKDIKQNVNRLSALHRTKIYLIFDLMHDIFILWSRSCHVYNISSIQRETKTVIDLYDFLFCPIVFVLVNTTNKLITSCSCFLLHILIYRQTCIRGVTCGTKKRWPYKTGDHLNDFQLI